MTRINLNGDWLLTSKQKPEVEVTMQVPGDNYSALLKAGVINDPYWGCNEQEVQWVRDCEWQISRAFELSQQQLSSEQLLLCLSRLDTVAKLVINGTEVDTFSNMFVSRRIDIKPYVQLGVNTICITFTPAHLEAKNRSVSLPFPIPSSMGSNNQIPHMNLLRKTQCHSGWDWGICLLVSGIYDDVFVSVVNEVSLDRVSTEQIWKQDGSVDVVVQIYHQAVSGVEISIGFDEVEKRITSTDGEVTSVSFTVETPKLWWPAGYGEQPLYDLNVTMDGQTINKRLGLRKLELNNAEDDIGSAMEFRINDFPITARGANWIPMDAMPARESKTRYESLLGDAVAANMNMIRVWGGGQYEADIFYQTCDELGLLVWQDLMFACSLYPSTQTFIDDVEPEVRYQVQRLKDHACIALWCGDNEVIGALNWYEESRNSRDRYVVNYDRLNRKLADFVTQEDPSRKFWSSSPCNGELDYGDSWHDDARGDMHFWEVWHSGASFNAYHNIKPRFCSEFGFQSWPSLSEVKTFVPQEDWNVTSPTFEGHQKNASGNSIITEMFTRYFRFPASFEQMLYLSQVQQSIAIKTGCEYWRSTSPICRGMLYWQLNDNWPVSSWSSIEYSGRWKQLHYHAKRVFAPTYVPFVETDDALTLRLVNNRRTQEKVTAEVMWMSWNGEPLGNWNLNLDIAPDENQEVWSLNKSRWQTRADHGFFFVRFKSQGEWSQNTWFAKPEVKQLAINKAKIQVEIDGSTIILTSDKPAFFVHLEHDGSGRFSDSSFTLLPNEPYQVNYIGEELETLLSTLRVYDLSNSY
ncbi:beta-mannosidase [Vibrio mediterranei]|uniref:Beta-mannosidase B n=1 Tax=Vibrio mediterranei TaxID=689 RepID=A0A3G4VIB8_9VIBR|nr:glycoside hydrolase family 2 protein [Vibrio mediterranei]AYV24530.1 glycoside hydrolase family 2 protein [Vibrio mediterranei]